jgi:hypothetical protein
LYILCIVKNSYIALVLINQLHNDVKFFKKNYVKKIGKGIFLLILVTLKAKLVSVMNKFL